MQDPGTRNPIFQAVSALLSSGHGGFQLIEEGCDLVVAACRYNNWIAGAKSPESNVKFSDDDWMAMLEELEKVYGQVRNAWREFESYDWPRGQFDVWKRQSETLRMAFQNARLRIDALGKAHGRSNQRNLVQRLGA